MNPVVHFEIPAKNKERIKKFYRTVFKWKLQQLGKEMGEYVLATTTKTNKNGMAKIPGNINGALMEETKHVKHTVIVIAVSNIKTSLNKVKKSGGKVLNEPMEIPGVGKYAYAKDTEGNVIGIIQPTR